ncbi:SRPBCC family protein [Aeromicrobium sp.]|uniref:SRPBCC family protein n=1 Tax=Aeromicrobium sp. TaxID=1871063 RepID=UPI0019A5FFB8|nr:SRPBCC family protein [Aeromicrobium sp.]MBC7633068.1 SRPBCC family protein [Aeromicrobium sp.]
MNSDTVSVERLIDATPARIFAELADAGKHQGFDGSGTVRGTKSPSRPLSLGTRFGMSMKMGVAYTTANTVVEYGQDMLIAWQTKGLGGLVGGRIWRYELTPTDGGTLVRETWDVSKDRQKFILKHSSFPEQTRKNMEKSLDRLAKVVA